MDGFVTAQEGVVEGLGLAGFSGLEHDVRWEQEFPGGRQLDVRTSRLKLCTYLCANSGL